MIEFTAAEIGYIEDAGVVICGAASNADGAEEFHYINFQRPVEAAGGDDAGVYFEVDDEVRGAYNVVSSCELAPGKLTIRLTEPLANGVGDTVVVRFSAPSTLGLGPIDEGLAKIFRGHEQLFRLHT